MFKKLNDDELQEWLEKQMEKENRSLENNFFSRIVGKQDDITDEELDRLYEDAVNVWKCRRNCRRKRRRKNICVKKSGKSAFLLRGIQMLAIGNSPKWLALLSYVRLLFSRQV